ncbi:hypothetical protein GCM10017044_22810 [Kordiimonas sediminis]|uniref:Uncharacterized protein n=1 Tax=Kordiimonas sediminis TaxID=1735581 RepID=A0A919AUS0_9PROT|nr:hypothetical protein [Kordiimonas sediminis]GHF27199.1 hypothetical protein GCM10017044_22810 [Kordiimonas sediminis]
MTIYHLFILLAFIGLGALGLAAFQEAFSEILTFLKDYRKKHTNSSMVAHLHCYQAKGAANEIR